MFIDKSKCFCSLEINKEHNSDLAIEEFGEFIKLKNNQLISNKLNNYLLINDNKNNIKEHKNEIICKNSYNDKYINTCDNSNKSVNSMLSENKRIIKNYNKDSNILSIELSDNSVTSKETNENVNCNNNETDVNCKNNNNNNLYSKFNFNNKIEVFSNNEHKIIFKNTKTFKEDYRDDFINNNQIYNNLIFNELNNEYTTSNIKYLTSNFIINNNNNNNIVLKKNINKQEDVNSLNNTCCLLNDSKNNITKYNNYNNKDNSAYLFNNSKYTNSNKIISKHFDNYLIINKEKSLLGNKLKLSFNNLSLSSNIKTKQLSNTPMVKSTNSSGSLKNPFRNNNYFKHEISNIKNNTIIYNTPEQLKTSKNLLLNILKNGD